jgi:hypothetical protein
VYILTRSPGPNYSLGASASCFRSRGYRVTRIQFNGYPGIVVFAPGFADNGGLPLVFTPTPAAANRVEQANFDSEPSQTHRNVAPIWGGLTDEPVFACLRSS